MEAESSGSGCGSNGRPNVVGHLAELGLKASSVGGDSGSFEVMPDPSAGTNSGSESSVAGPVPEPLSSLSSGGFSGDHTLVAGDESSVSGLPEPVFASEGEAAAASSEPDEGVDPVAVGVEEHPRNLLRHFVLPVQPGLLRDGDLVRNKITSDMRVLSGAIEIHEQHLQQVRSQAGREVLDDLTLVVAPGSGEVPPSVTLTSTVSVSIFVLFMYLFVSVLGIASQPRGLEVLLPQLSGLLS